MLDFRFRIIKFILIILIDIKKSVQPLGMNTIHLWKHLWKKLTFEIFVLPKSI